MTHREQGFLETKKKPPVLVARFESIRKKPPHTPNLKNFNSLFDSGEFRQHCFDEVLKAWQFMFQPETIAAYLHNPQQPEHFKYLKQVRRFGLILKSMYQIFGSSHASPKGLKVF